MPCKTISSRCPICAPAPATVAASPAISSSRLWRKWPACAPMSRGSSILGCSPMPPNSAVLEAPLRHVHKPLPHDSGAKHVQGNAEYVDDIPEPTGTLHLAVGGAPVARGTLRRLDLDAVRAAPGVVAVIVAADIPGK